MVLSRLLGIKTFGELIITLSFSFNSYLELRQLSWLYRYQPCTDLPSFPTLSGEKISQIRAYQIDKSLYRIGVLLTNFCILLALIHFNFYSSLWNFCVLSTSGEYLPVLSFTFVYSLMNAIVSLPIEWIEHFIIEQRHGFNKMTTRLFLTDEVKKTAIGILLSLLINSIVQFALISFKEYFVTIVTGGVIALMLLLLVLYPTVIAPLFNKYTLLDTENAREKELLARAEGLAKKVGFPLEKVYKMDGSKRSDHSQAYFFGVFRKKQIVLYDTLIEKLEVDEIIAVLCHEIGHWNHSHHVCMIAVQCAVVLTYTALLRTCLAVDGVESQFEIKQKSEFFRLFLFIIFLEPLGILIKAIVCFISRKNEFQADQFAVTQGYSNQLVTGLVKVFADNKATLEKDEIYSLFHDTHPDLPQRIKAIQNSKKNQ